MEEMNISLLGKRIAEKELFDQFIAGLGQLATVVLHCQTMLVELLILTVEWSIRKHLMIVIHRTTISDNNSFLILSDLPARPRIVDGQSSDSR